MTYVSKFLAYAALAASLVLVFAVAGHAQESVLTHASIHTDYCGSELAHVALNIAPWL
ncbi:MAG: hypothetical protein ACOH2N_12425 [Devosia sp.]